MSTGYFDEEIYKLLIEIEKSLKNIEKVICKNKESNGGLSVLFGDDKKK